MMELQKSNLKSWLFLIKTIFNSIKQFKFLYEYLRAIETIFENTFTCQFKKSGALCVRIARKKKIT